MHCNTTFTMNKIGYLFLGFILLVFTISLKAQLTQTFIEPDASFKQAKLLYQQDQYSLAYPLFKLFYSNGIKNSNLPVQVLLESKYYYIICGLQLNDESAVALAKSFIELELDVAHTQLTAYYLGEYYYQKKDYGNALQYFDKTNIANLNNRQIAEMKFHQAYAYFVGQQFDKAKPLFNSIRQLPNDPNFIDANYYYGFLLFNDQKYDEAITFFEIAEKEAAYKNVVPFYLAELYYFNGESDKALAYGEKILQSSKQYYDLQLQQLVGHILFEKRQFNRALPYLEKYVVGNEKVRREDLYELSYCYYEAKNWSKAIVGFKQLGGAADSLAQNSMYLLADAYLKVNELSNARNAFQFCATNNSNPKQKEVSSFHYAKLSYDLSYYGIAANDFKLFIANYVKSKYIPEARILLISSLANTSNYKDALAIYELLQNKSEEAEKIYPRILYGRSAELMNDQQTVAAEMMLDKIAAAKFNEAQMPLVNFWKGELNYRNGKTDVAIIYLQNYLKNPLKNEEVNSANARYNLAYCYLKNENYQSAKEQFELVYKTINGSITEIQKDAFLRIGDCCFIAKDYKQSLTVYNEVIQNGWQTADYALFQKAIIAGAMNKQNDKLQQLGLLEQQYPNSAILPNAQLEIANTYLAEEEYEKSLAPLYKVINNDKAISLRPQAYLKLGIALFNLDKNDASLDQFKLLITKYPNSIESDASVDYIRNIFIEQQKPGEYINFMETNGKTLNANEADSVTYKSAMIRYEAKDNFGAQSGFAEYILKFPDGKYKVEANYFLAEINISQKDYANALPFYNKVADLAPNKYAERSTLQSARIYFFDLKNFIEAANYYSLLKRIASQQENRLEAMRGLLRCQFKLQQFAEAAPNAIELLQQKGIAADDQLMGEFVVAKNDQLNGRNDQALLGYKLLLNRGKSEITAESQYQIAQIYLQSNKFGEAEKAGFEVIKKYGSYDNWVTKSYLLIGDVYFKQNDLFNAEATYKSVLDNATIPELKKEAGEKLIQIIAAKEKVNKIQ
jgi:TolA-binding protein